MPANADSDECPLLPRACLRVPACQLKTLSQYLNGTRSSNAQRIILHLKGSDTHLSLA
jgi:hypothetical protein